MLFCQTINFFCIKLFDHSGDKLNCLIVVVSVNDTCVAVDVAGWYSDHKVWHPATVEVNSP
jgi:hypothetical protein